MKSQFNFFIAFFLVAIAHQITFGQASVDSLDGGLSLSVNGHYGFVIPEYSSFILLTDEPVRSGEISLEKRLGAKNSWNAIYNYPTVGLTLFYTTLGSSEVHGSEIALFPFIRLPVFQSPKFNAGISLGLGLGYVTKTYDEETNPYNVVVGSNLNAHFQTKVDLRYQLSDALGIQTGLAFGHLSNANTAEPNIGINNGTIYLGLNYVLKRERLAGNTEEFSPSKKVFYEVALAPGFKSTRALKDSRHFTLSATGDLWKPLSRIISVGIGPDIFYDGSAETELTIDDSKTYEPIMQWSTGIHGSFSLRYDRLRLILQAGVYVGLANEVEDEPIYNRAMVRYDVSEKFIAYFAMKSHLHILDHPEFGFGYRWGK
ncbi:acyloxyacyl hydrolase [Cryomorphaceae bacterium 1068]|nr:acyloxyacyl hydrolase [Cryomorphaceae bacterium 1068]